MSNNAIRRDGTLAVIGPAITGQVFLMWGSEVLRVFYSADGPAATRREAIAEFEILTRRDYKCRVCGEREAHVWWPMRCHYCDTDNAQVFDPAL